MLRRQKKHTKTHPLTMDNIPGCVKPLSSTDEPTTAVAEEINKQTYSKWDNKEQS